MKPQLLSRYYFFPEERGVAAYLNNCISGFLMELIPEL
jgi:hypothetical protein